MPELWPQVDTTDSWLQQTKSTVVKKNCYVSDLTVNSFPFCCLMCLFQHECGGGPVARDSHTYVGVLAAPSACDWHNKKTATEEKPECSQLPPSLLLSICSQVLENLLPYMPLTHSQMAFWSVCVCVWWNGTKGGAHITFSSYSPRCPVRHTKSEFSVCDKQIWLSKLWINLCLKLSLHVYI